MKTKALFDNNPRYFKRGMLLAGINIPIIVLCTDVGAYSTFSGVVVHVEEKYNDPDDEVGTYAEDWIKESFEYFSGELTMRQ